MTQPQPLVREVDGGDLEVSAERRRARILGRILESSQRLHERHDVVGILHAFIGVTQDLFADCALLLVTNPALGGQSERAIAHNDFEGTEEGFALRLASEVADSGIPSFSAEFEIGSDRLAGCVPLCVGATCLGAVYVSVPCGVLSSSDELTQYLRLLSMQASLALNTASNIRRLGEDLSIMSVDGGVDLARDDVPLTVAKRAFEKWLIAARLKKSKGNIAAAARALKMDRGQLSRLVKRHEIDACSYRG